MDLKRFFYNSPSLIQTIALQHVFSKKNTLCLITQLQK